MSLLVGLALIGGASLLGTASASHAAGDHRTLVDGFEDGTITDIWELTLPEDAKATIVTDPVRHGERALKLVSACGDIDGDSETARARTSIDTPDDRVITVGTWINPRTSHEFGVWGGLLLQQAETFNPAIQYRLGDGDEHFEYKFTSEERTVHRSFGSWKVGTWYHISITLDPVRDAVTFTASTTDGLIGQHTVEDVPTSYEVIQLIADPGGHRGTCHDTFVFDDVTYAIDDRVVTTLNAESTVALTQSGTSSTVPYLYANLTNARTDVGIPGKTILFTTLKGDALCTAVTNVDGVAECTPNVNGIDDVKELTSEGFRATFQGDDEHRSSSGEAPFVEHADPSP